MLVDDKRQEEATEEVTGDDVNRLLDLGRLLKTVLNDYELNELREILHEKENQE